MADEKFNVISSKFKYNPVEDCDEFIAKSNSDVKINIETSMPLNFSYGQDDSIDSDNERPNNYFYRNMPNKIDIDAMKRKRSISTSAFYERSIGIELREISDLFISDHELLYLIQLGKNRRKSMPIFTYLDNNEIIELNKRFEEQIHHTTFPQMSKYSQISLD